MKKKYYQRITHEERCLIEYLLTRDASYTAMASQLGREVSTITREVYRGGGKERYCSERAQKRASVRATARRQYKRLIARRPVLRQYIHDRLRCGWSPQQIMLRLHHDHPDDTDMHVSIETIYAYIYALPKGELKRELISSLRRKHHYRYDRNRRKLRAQQPNRATIGERPEYVTNREIPGHWEGDLVKGYRNQSAVGTLVERTSRFGLVVPLKALDAPHVARAFARAFLRLPVHVRRSLTYDQGKEMSKQHWLARAVGIDVYITNPRSPWERGTNENFNGLLRQYFPKGTDFSQVPLREIARVQDLLNGRPRKVLDARTPAEVFNDFLH